ncbi:MAG: hypothetical protein ACKOW8_09225, partial [Flavobacteriales bacterium]
WRRVLVCVQRGEPEPWTAAGWGAKACPISTMFCAAQTFSRVRVRFSGDRGSSFRSSAFVGGGIPAGSEG